MLFTYLHLTGKGTLTCYNERGDCFERDLKLSFLRPFGFGFSFFSPHVYEEGLHIPVESEGTIHIESPNQVLGEYHRTENFDIAQVGPLGIVRLTGGEGREVSIRLFFEGMAPWTLRVLSGAVFTVEALGEPVVTPAPELEQPVDPEEERRQEEERLEQERLEQERLEQERLEQERLEQERLERRKT